MQSLDFIVAFIEPLERNQIPYFVTGSFASIFYGEPRLTHDIDFVVHLSEAAAKTFSAFFPPDQFYCPPSEVIQIESKRRPYGHFNLIHYETGFKADLYPEAGDQPSQWAFQHRRRVELTKDFAVWIAPAEYVILRKLEFFREGGSEKHLEDIRKMLPQIRPSLDLVYLLGELEKRNLVEHWQAIPGAVID